MNTPLLPPAAELKPSHWFVLVTGAVLVLFGVVSWIASDGSIPWYLSLIWILWGTQLVGTTLFKLRGARGVSAGGGAPGSGRR